MKKYLPTVLLVALILASCSSRSAESERPVPQAALAARTLYDLGGLDALKGYFNENAGQTRLILLLSPT